MNRTRRLVTVALLTSSALVAGLAESRFPLPFPGMRLGIANVFTLAALISLGPAEAAAVSLGRLAMSFLLGGNAGAFACSAGGLALSLPVMTALYKIFPKSLSVPAISAAGAYAFNIGQLAAIAAIMRANTVFAYLPPLLLVAAATGYAVGRAAEWIGDRVRP
ncbi:MAG: Gx transporter family protein [Synergistaceae bacterium]|jgi:heptaprenyl diphosphate synthase|nr:Gx transporter family protein [Synergistaceae bacterium]